MLGSVPDLLRLVAVPVLGWAAWRDVKTRRVPNRTWIPLAALGAVALAWELLGHLPPAGFADQRYLFRVAFSLAFVAPLSYGFWRVGGFGGADAKALMTLAVVFPTFPSYAAGGLPATRTALGVFSMTVLTNTVLLGVTYPVALAVRNAASGEFSKLMFLGRRIDVSAVTEAHGRLFEGADGFTRRGLDLDALRMYLRWRGATLDALRADPEGHRDPASVGETHDPGDGAVAAGTASDTVAPDGGAARAGDAGDESGAKSTAGDTEREADPTGDGADETRPASDVEADDPWAAEAFLASIDGTAYGTDAETLRAGLDLLVARDRVWLSPGIPFLVPMFFGLVVALTYGDLLFGLFGLLGFA